jgi:hypothetical protein
MLRARSMIFRFSILILKDVQIALVSIEPFRH